MRRTLQACTQTRSISGGLEWRGDQEEGTNSGAGEERRENWLRWVEQQHRVRVALRSLAAGWANDDAAFNRRLCLSLQESQLGVETPLTIWIPAVSPPWPSAPTLPPVCKGPPLRAPSAVQEKWTSCCAISPSFSCTAPLNEWRWRP